MMVLSLGEKIKLKRKEKSMTLKDLAGDRITPGQISLVESGKSNPSIDLLEYISQRLDTDLDYFLESEKRQASRICEYYTNIAEAALNLDDMPTARNAIEKGLYYSVKYDLHYLKGVLEMLNANINYICGVYEEAQQFCLSANSIFLKNDNIEQIVKSLLLLGNISLKMGHINTALNYFEQSSRVLMENNYAGEFLRARVYYSIAVCYSRMNNIEKSIKYAGNARDKLDILMNKKDYAKMLLDIGIKFGEENNLQDASKYAREAKKVLVEINDIHELADIEANLGVMFTKGNNASEAFKHYERALALKNQINDITIADTILKMCKSYIDFSDFEKAFEAVNNALEIIDDDQHTYRIRCYEYLFIIYDKKGDKTKAEEILLDGLNYLKKLNYRKQLGDFYSMLGKFYLERNRKEQALDFISRGLTIYQELGIILS